MTNSPRTRRERAFRWAVRSRRRLLIFGAALPLFQLPACAPDLLGAVNFEIQSLVNSVLINAVVVIVSDLLGI